MTDYYSLTHLSCEAAIELDNYRLEGDYKNFEKLKKYTELFKTTHQEEMNWAIWQIDLSHLFDPERKLTSVEDVKNLGYIHIGRLEAFIKNPNKEDLKRISKETLEASKFFLERQDSWINKLAG
jgi:hypothetical protein